MISYHYNRICCYMIRNKTICFTNVQHLAKLFGDSLRNYFLDTFKTRYILASVKSLICTIKGLSVGLFLNFVNLTNCVGVKSTRADPKNSLCRKYHIFTNFKIIIDLIFSLLHSSIYDQERDILLNFNNLN